ncbi:cation diffusion facilitator family transporter [Hansschlegelia beijingensis]|uniref:Cation diffusion facilitator family transporter n=1 Tax=Hansschlegelia beijingensis TaxID=1133344 RepID=A0A7W6GIE1_9HYPH|nr:cation diffusion facilitator family transporter [Hansschlegelia beijingensis]MBB3974749.1 cation diffusion facilitator family transporter [Hansschlegelia beijingensis]
MDEAARLASATLAVGLLVLGLKAAAYLLTGSAALYSDAAESVVNVAAAAALIVAVRLAAAPPDRNHPYGHHKAEYVSAVLEGALIVIAAGAILHEAWSAWRYPREIEFSAAGLGANLAASVINGIWCAVLVRRGKALRSPALAADGQHLLADVISSVGVLAGIAAALLTGQLWLDPLIACAVALNVLWSGAKLVRTSVGGLMDEAASPAAQDRIRGVIATNAEGAIEAHDLRTRHAGRLTFVDFHLVVAGDMRVTEAHDICDRIERALHEEDADMVVTIHVEPDDKAKHAGIVVL